MGNVLCENGFPIYALVSGQMVEVQEVRHGRWELYDICSVCGAQADGQTNYCPNCGARMDEVTE